MCATLDINTLSDNVAERKTKHIIWVHDNNTALDTRRKPLERVATC